jgi:hypothetical protein
MSSDSKKVDVVYSFFGLSIRSSAEIPGVCGAPAPSRDPDIQIHWKCAPGKERFPLSESETLHYSTSETDESGQPALRIWNIAGGEFWHLEYFDGTQFWLDREVKNIWVDWGANSSVEDAASYLLGPVLGLALRLRGVTCLHASAVSVDGFAVVFAGPEGAGKSTAAAAMAQASCPVISDDVVALVEHEDSFRVLPAYPYLSLWPDSVEFLNQQPVDLPRFSKNWEKRRLAVGTGEFQFESRMLPLRAIYLLGDRPGDFAPRVEEIPVQSALLAIIANSYATNILDAEMRAQEFKLFGRLLSHVRVRNFYPPRDRTRLKDLPKLILEDLNGPLKFRS